MVMNVKINGKLETFEDEVTIGEILDKKKIRHEYVTVELNEKILPRNFYNETFAKDGDVIEFVFYMGGGIQSLKQEDSEIPTGEDGWIKP